MCISSVSIFTVKKHPPALSPKRAAWSARFRPQAAPSVDLLLVKSSEEATSPGRWCHLHLPAKRRRRAIWAGCQAVTCWGRGKAQAPAGQGAEQSGTYRTRWEVRLASDGEWRVPDAHWEDAGEAPIKLGCCCSGDMAGSVDAIVCRSLLAGGRMGRRAAS